MMIFPAKYKALSQNVFKSGEFQIIPIRYRDRISIMKWRNNQVCNLRQSNLLTTEAQNYYFENVISKLFDSQKPPQILFSYLKNDICIGYGGLVHIDWESKNAEISFEDRHGKTVNKKLSDLNINPSGSYEIKN